MTNRLDLLIVGPQGPLEEVLEHLETQENYRLHCYPDFEAARQYLGEHAPDAIIVAVEAGEPETVRWLEAVRNVAPVLVFCPVENLQFYMNIMEHGAFDFFTVATPLDEIDRELNSAAEWHARQAA